MIFSRPNRLQGQLGTALLSVLLAGYAGQASAQAGAATGAFTAQQASAGAALFQSTCAACHGAQLQGTPTAPLLAGTPFLARWGTRAAGDLFRQVKSSMPPGGTTPLSDETVGNIVAYIMQVNGATAGTVALSANTTAQVGSGIQAAAAGGAQQRPAAAPEPLGVTVAGTVENFVPITDEMMRNPDPSDWLMMRGNYQAWSFSELDRRPETGMGVEHARRGFRARADRL
jgi:mono/diheme cytochrome c family protein